MLAAARQDFETRAVGGGGEPPSQAELLIMLRAVADGEPIPTALQQALLIETHRIRHITGTPDGAPFDITALCKSPPAHAASAPVQLSTLDGTDGFNQGVAGPNGAFDTITDGKPPPAHVASAPVKLATLDGSDGFSQRVGGPGGVAVDVMSAPGKLERVRQEVEELSRPVGQARLDGADSFYERCADGAAVFDIESLRKDSPYDTDCRAVLRLILEQPAGLEAEALRTPPPTHFERTALSLKLYPGVVAAPVRATRHDGDRSWCRY